MSFWQISSPVGITKQITAEQERRKAAEQRVTHFLKLLEAYGIDLNSPIPAS